jgi:hypothetical protein
LEDDPKKAEDDLKKARASRKSVSGLSALLEEQTRQQKMLNETSSSVMLAFLSTVALVGVTFVIDLLVIKIPNMGYVLFAYLMISMLIIRMQWVRHAELEQAAGIVPLA